jgi:hypothetical protein
VSARGDVSGNPLDDSGFLRLRPALLKIAADAPAEAVLPGARAVEPGIDTCDGRPGAVAYSAGQDRCPTRYGNIAGGRTRMDSLTGAVRSAALVRFAGNDRLGNPVASKGLFVTATCAGTTYPNYKPARSLSVRRPTASI